MSPKKSREIMCREKVHVECVQSMSRSMMRLNGVWYGVVVYTI
jgi:hypothetical protein